MKHFLHLSIKTVIAAALALSWIPSCDIEDPNWKPTLAVPLIRESKISADTLLLQGGGGNLLNISKDQVQEFWDEYTQQHSADSVNKAAYNALLETRYVNNSTNPPTVTAEAAALFGQAQTDSINDFLAASAAGTLDPNSPLGQEIVSGAISKIMENDKTGILNLGGSLIDVLDKLSPPSALPASMLRNTQGSYINRINETLNDTTKFKLDMRHEIPLSLSSVGVADNGMEWIEITSELGSNLPIYLTAHVNLVDANGNVLYKLFGATGLKLEPNAEPIPTVKRIEGKEVNTILTETTKVVVEIENSEFKLTAASIRDFSEKFLTVEMRMRSQIKASSLK